MQEEGWVYTIYATFNIKNRDIGYSFLNIQLCVIEELEILQEYIDLEEVSNKEAI